MMSILCFTWKGFGHGLGSSKGVAFVSHIMQWVLGLEYCSGTGRLGLGYMKPWIIYLLNL